VNQSFPNPAIGPLWANILRNSQQKNVGKDDIAEELKRRWAP